MSPTQLEPSCTSGDGAGGQQRRDVRRVDPPVQEREIHPALPEHSPPRQRWRMAGDRFGGSGRHPAAPGPGPPMHHAASMPVASRPRTFDIGPAAPEPAQAGVRVEGDVCCRSGDAVALGRCRRRRRRGDRPADPHPDCGELGRPSRPAGRRGRRQRNSWRLRSGRPTSPTSASRRRAARSACRICRGSAACPICSGAPRRPGCGGRRRKPGESMFLARAARWTPMVSALTPQSGTPRSARSRSSSGPTGRGSHVPTTSFLRPLFGGS